LTHGVGNPLEAIYLLVQHNEAASWAAPVYLKPTGKGCGHDETVNAVSQIADNQRGAVTIGHS
jgi:hypothetical protein